MLFYKSFNNPFPYTRLGKITDSRGLAELLAGKENVKVRFEK